MSAHPHQPIPTSFYRRPLPDGQIPFASPEGRQIFREALAAGHMEGWFALAEQFHTQAEPAFCGLGTLVVALNALEIDPGRVWKGPWRWYGEDLLDCCQPLEAVQQKGLTLDELACLAHCNGAAGTTIRADAAGADALREAVRQATSAPRGRVLIAAYTRAALEQTGGGHFSPIAGYHPQRDLVLILDVARFKYPPHWVPLRALWDAMRPVDPDTGRARGWVLLERAPERVMPLYFRLSAGGGLGELVAALLEEAPALLAQTSTETEAALVAGWVHAVEARLGAKVRDALRPGAPPPSLPPEHRSAVEALLGELRQTAAFHRVREAREGGADGRVPDEVLATLLLALPDEVLASLPPATEKTLRALRAPGQIGPALATEIAALGEQLTALRQWSCSRQVGGEIGGAGLR